MHKFFSKPDRTTFLLVGLLCLTVSVQAQVPSLSGLDTYVQKSMKDWGVPGLAVAVVHDDSTILAKGYGVRELGKDAKVDEYTLFAIASNTKAFTASLLAILVEQGRLAWDDRVIDYLRDFQMVDPYVTREITVRDLLTHRSGLPTFGGDHLWIGNSLSRDEIISRIRYLEPTAPFRTRFQYQNLMFLVAGQIIPAITDKTWDEAIRDWIFTPLGMTESNTTIRDLKDKENVAIPHEIVDGKRVPIEYDNLDNSAPAGAINANVVEMTRWMRLNLNRGVYDGRQILSTKRVREMQTIQFPLPVSVFNEETLEQRFAGYDLGWFISDYKGYKVVNHGGGLSGMISLQTLLPDKKLGVIVLTNFAPNNLTRALTYWILDKFLGEPEQDWSRIYLDRRKQAEERRKKREHRLREERIKETKPSHRLEAYTGKYVDKLSGQADVRLEKGKLVFDYNPRHIADLDHWHYDTFRVIWRHPIFDMAAKSFLTFQLDETGKVAGLEVTFYDPIHFEKMSEPNEKE